MWASAAKWIAKFDEGVLNALDSTGAPLSVRQTSMKYDAATGTMQVTIPKSLDATEGPASLLCHSHDENLWNMSVVLVKGKIERRDGSWTFVTTAFEPPSNWKMMRSVGKSATAYHSKRNLPRPEVDFDAIAKLWERAKAISGR